MTNDSILSQEQIEHIKQVGIEESLSHLGLAVIHRRKLPDYYLRRECVAQGADPEAVKNWFPTNWVTNTGRVAAQDPRIRERAITVLQAIHQRLAHHPPNESYTEARARLRKALNQLVINGVPRARIADLTRVNHKTVRSALEYSQGRPTSNAHCPWDLLDRINSVDWSQHQNTQEDSPGRPITEREVQRLRNKDRQSREQAQRPEIHYVEPGGTCWHCGATWPNLQEEAPEHPGAPVTLICRICSRVSHLQPPPP